MTMAGRYIIAGLILIVLAANAVRGVAAQQCVSASVKTYVERRENATRAVINDIMMIVGSLGVNVSVSSQPGTTREKALYDSLTDSFGLDQSNDSFDAFSSALTTITDAYFQSCFGPMDSRPSLVDAPALIHTLLSDLLMFTGGRNQSLLTTIRNIFGRLTCLVDSYHETPSSFPTDAPDPDCNDSSTLTILNFRQCINSTKIQPIFGLGPLVVVKQMVVQSRRCVGFVVDDTGSMGEEIASVRTLILNFINAEQNLPACYVLVTFNDFGASTPLGNLGIIRVYDPQISSSTTQTPTITRTGGAAVYGTNELIANVSALHAHGGGDCPEYGMTGILQAISSIQSVQDLVIPQQGNLHHIIVLTDASAKDDSNYSIVINAAAHARVTVHFFYSGSGCAGTFGHYEDVRIASGGIKVTSITDFDAFGTFIQLYNEAIAAGSTSSKRKRQSSTGDIFSVYSTCHNFNTSLFTPNLALLVRTSQPSITITRPDGTTHSLTVAGSLGLFQESNPTAGMWTACASPGTLQVAVNAPIIIELDVSFTKKTESGEILPSSEIPSACTTGTIFVRTPQLPLISLNHTVYLEFVEEDGSIAKSAILTECAGVFTGEVTFPGSLVFYQLRGRDIQANPFAHVIPGTERRFKGPSLALTLANFQSMPVNPGMSSFHKLWLQYTGDSGPTLKPFFQAGEPQGVSVQYYQLPTSIRPSERRLVVVELTGSSMLTVGNNLTLMANVTENCTDVVMESSYYVTVYQPVTLSVTNTTTTMGKRLLIVRWDPPAGLDVYQYKLVLDYDNGTVVTTFLTPSTLATITDTLTPYRRMFISLAVVNSSGDVVAFAGPRPFRSREGVSGPVTRIVATPTSNSSARISWDPPELPNGVITTYYIRVERHDGQPVFEQRNISAIAPRQLEVTGLKPYSRYRTVLAAENSVGRGDQKEHEFYSKQGVPIGAPGNFQERGLSRTSAQISWDPPPVEERRGFIVKYTITVTYSMNGETQTRSYVTPERSANVTGLPDLARVNVTVSSATEVGQGPSSPAFSFDVEIAPSEPRQLSGFPQGFTAVSLNWLPPEQSNGVIRNYKLRYRNSASSFTGEKVVENTFDSEQRPTAVVDGLSWDSYVFVVAASTSAGYGPESEETSVDLSRHSGSITAVLILVPLVVIVGITCCVVLWVVVKIRKNKSNNHEDTPSAEPEKTELFNIKQ